MTDHHTVLENLAALLTARTAWDEDAELYTLHTTPAGTVVLPMGLPRAYWHMAGDPKQAVGALAASIRVIGSVPFLGHVPTAYGPPVGVALRMESYAIDSTRQDTPQVAEATRRLVAGGSLPPLRTIPGRLEQRHVQALTLDGHAYDVSGTRLTNNTMGTPEKNHFPPGRKGFLVGPAMDVLRSLLEALAEKQVAR
ncbi:hypothetical protein ACN20G_28290 (plasmid) [Streptomyces sp. BI20]|uniref:hypothetical protein n=1 Tax=Streptomyces sp. BI20 TaxID=3403460 RepID=UPI003C770B32